MKRERSAYIGAIMGLSCAVAYLGLGPKEPDKWHYLGGHEWATLTNDAEATILDAWSDLEEISGCRVVEVISSPEGTLVMGATDCDATS